MFGFMFCLAAGHFKVRALTSVFLLYLAVFSYGTVYYAVQGGSNLKSVDENLSCVTIQIKAIEQYFHVVMFIMLYTVLSTFKSVDENLVCDHSNESYSNFIWYCLS